MASLLETDLSAPVDLADVWLEHGLEQLLQACAPLDDAHRADTSRLSVAFAALAVEARINRVVREHDPERWGADARLTPLEKFQLVPQLLHESELATHNELAELVVELFDLRDELVEAGPTPTALDPQRACAMVTAGARLCRFLDPADDRAVRVHEIAATFAPRARAAASAPAADASEDFPPDIVGS